MIEFGPDLENEREAKWLLRMLRIDLYPEPIPELALGYAITLILLLRTFVRVESIRQANRLLEREEREKRPASGERV